MAAESVSRQPMSTQQIRIAVLVVLAVVIGVVVWLVAFHSSNHKKHLVKGIGPKAFSGKNLKAESVYINTKFYWAGPVHGDSYEFTRTTKGYLYVRYLPHGVHVGAKGAHFLIITTYPGYTYAALKGKAKGRGVKGPGGSLVYVNPKDHKSVLMAFPNGTRQIEIYSPDPAVALQTALSGKITLAR